MCLDDQILNTYLDNELAEPWKSQVEEHLGYCSACKDRYKKLKELQRTIQEAALSQEEMEPRKENVLRMIENTCFKRKRIPFLRRQFRLSLPAFATVAAAFVCVFVGSIIYINKESNDFIPAAVENAIDESNVNLISNAGLKKTIDDYSLEEILSSLDKRGYSVDLKLKSVQPVEF